MKWEKFRETVMKAEKVCGLERGQQRKLVTNSKDKYKRCLEG